MAVKRKTAAKKCLTKGSKKKLSGKVFTTKLVSKSKAAAIKAATAHRAKGKTKLARVVKTCGGYAVLTRG